MSCADIDCKKISLIEAATTPLGRRCCPHGSRAITPAKKKSQGQKDIEEFVRGKNPPDDKKNTSEDTRNILEKVAQDGTSAGGKPGDDEEGGGSGTGDSDNCTGCDKAGDIGCELGKLSCEFTSSMGDSMPLIAIGIGAVIVLLVVLR